ncbi:MAG TPA: Spy/CpxP family protein refolding chaperone [Bryobacteraceae bacterium]|nr:Spy/CpxP family protein refolding chaperone [Bryobacteraceae bacterium]
MVGRVVVAALLTAGLVAAQRGGGGMGGSRGGDMGMGMPRSQQTKLDQIADKLKLSKEQKAQVADILSSAAESAAPLSQQIGKGRGAIASDLATGTDSTGDCNKLQDLLAQMDGIEATAYGKIYALLKPNQQKNAEQVFDELMAGMFIRSGGGGGGRRRGQ